MPTDDDRWEDEFDSIEEPMFDDEDDSKERPPQVTPEELAALDLEATQTEIAKLKRLGVIEEVPENECGEDSKYVDLTSVFDWRYRENKWQRRCRIVAREYRQQSGTSAETFSPTSGGSIVRLVLMFHLLFHWKLYAIDVRDAFLSVDQKESMFVQPRKGMAESGVLWKLLKVLPHQRNGALRWFEAFSQFLMGLGFLQCAGVPSLLRHESRPLVINIHVDDELVAAGNIDEAEWLFSELRKKYRMEVEGPCPVDKQGQGEKLAYLKKNYVFTPDGIVVKPSNKYYDNLNGVYGQTTRKPKRVPEHEKLSKVDFSAELNADRQALFRSGLGTAMYLSLHRIDVQYSIKCLASFMKNPTEQAEICLRQLISYLNGTSNFGMLMSYTRKDQRLIHLLNGHDSESIGKQHGFEVFCDSDWGGSATRKSTTSVIILLDGVVVYSYSRNQKSIALSSCEAEILAATSAASETILLQGCWEFLTRERCTVQIRTDSSSARQWLQRTGVGRLKHYSIRLLWLQESIRNGSIDIAAVGTKLNVADLNTKKLSVARRRFLQYHLGVVAMNSQNEIIERIGENEVHQNFMDEQMKMHVKRISKCVYKSGGNIERILMLALVSQMAVGVDATAGNERHTDEWFWPTVLGVSCYFAGMGEKILLMTKNW